MRKNSLIILVATLMILSSLAVGLETTAAGNGGWSSASPQVLPGNTENGNVFIYADGSVSNTSVIHQSGNTYSLLTNINGTLTIEANNSIFNGNGLTIENLSNSNSVALRSTNTTGLVIENLVVGNSTQYGIQLGRVYNSVLDNISSVNFDGNTIIQVGFSDNVTVENSNFSLNAPVYGIDAEFDGALNISGNHFSGWAGSAFIYGLSITSMYVYGNTILSNSTGSDGIYIEHSGNSWVSDNYVNDTAQAFYWYVGNNVVSANNIADNYTLYGYYVYWVNSYTSTGDSAQFGAHPIHIEYAGPIFISGANFHNYTSSLWVYYFGNLTITHSNITSAATGYLVNIAYGATFNFLDSSLTDMSVGDSSSTGIGVNYSSGMITFANDNINVNFSNEGSGLGLYYSPYLTVTNSTISNAYYSIWSEYSISSATLTNNTFILPYEGYGVYLYGYYSPVDNVIFNNNTVYSLNTTSPAYYALYLLYNYDEYSTSNNITVSGNTILNVDEPIYLYGEYENYGNYVSVQHNFIVNSTYAIYVYNYGNSIINSNKIVNTSEAAIEVYANAPNTIISNNYIVNMPGYGGMGDGINVQDLYGGYNAIFGNTLVNLGQYSNGIYVDYSSPVLVYGNTINASEDAINVYESYTTMVFNNIVNAASFGIYSEDNQQVSYYGNTINNANTSFFSEEDTSIYVFANTFSDAQTNSSNLYFLELYYYTSMSFYHNNFINDTTNSTTHYSIEASSILFMYQPLPVGGNYYSNYTGTGSNGIGSTPMNLSSSVQDIYPLLYEWTSPTVTFVENGLPTGTAWSVSVGGNMLSGTNSTLLLQQVNGEFSSSDYTVASVPGYIASVSSGTVNLHGTSSVVTIDFTPVEYSLSFVQSTLPTGTSWSVTLNGDTHTSTGSTISFTVANGTYGYSVGSVSGYTSATSTGSVSVSGAGKSVSVQFTAVQYNLTINQVGLPSGDTWTVTVGGNSYNSTSGSVVVQLPAGTYNITVTGPSGYSVSVPSDNVTVSSTNHTFAVTFTSSNKTTGGIGAGTLYGGIGAAAVVGGVAGIFGTMFYTGTGIFRKLKGE